MEQSQSRRGWHGSHPVWNKLANGSTLTKSGRLGNIYHHDTNPSIDPCPVYRRHNSRKGFGVSGFYEKKQTPEM